MRMYSRVRKRHAQFCVVRDLSAIQNFFLGSFERFFFLNFSFEHSTSAAFNCGIFTQDTLQYLHTMVQRKTR